MGLFNDSRAVSIYGRSSYPMLGQVLGLQFYSSSCSHYYCHTIVDKCNSSISDMKKLEEMKKNLDEISQNPV
ncbi:hypothetical protein GWI33_019405 [Rhynchophorus ferrugineus]|uniref:Uncharacterized protein n=1 Tax=Rhynchophorus ferrugineus TaxID=354439 RepID=A0A834M1G1_RHYFE|nr:hypothetical protein GWI33_019405 [Rhynchophorus ferrugineus]